MRGYVDIGKLEQFMRALGERATSPGTVYLVGGSTALLMGIREQTVDIDLKLLPEPGGAFQAIAVLKDELSVNVELASPDDFLPPLPGWQARSIFIATHGMVVFRHYDLYSQVLAKLERGHTHDLSDARYLMDRANLDPDELRRLASAIKHELARYPAVDLPDFENKLYGFLNTYRKPTDDRSRNPS